MIVNIYVLQRTKPRGLIDLNCSYLYQVHDSFFERPNCFQLVEKELPCLATVTYLCSDSLVSTFLHIYVIVFTS